jgi:hypothetical protein
MPLIKIGTSDSDFSVATTNGVNRKDTIPSVNLVNFRGLIGDFARSYLFQIHIPQMDDSSQALTMLAKSTTLPSYNLEDKGFEFQGSKYKMAGHATFDDWSVTFLADEYHKLRHKFLAWSSLIYDPIRQVPFMAGSYKKNGVRVLQLSKDGQIVSGYEFFGLYPSRVGEINLDQGAKEVETFTVTFSYDYYIINTDVVGNTSSVDESKINSNVYAVDYNFGKKYNGVTSGIDANQNDKINSGDINNRKEDSTALTGADKRTEGAVNGSTVVGSRNSIKNVVNTGDISNRKDDGVLLSDNSSKHNKEKNINGIASNDDSAFGFLSNFKALNPFATGDINTPDPAGFLDYANWMSFRYSPPLRFRIRNYLGKDINNNIEKFNRATINPYKGI